MEDYKIKQLVYRLLSGTQIFYVQDKEIIYNPPSMEVLGRAEFFWHRWFHEVRGHGWMTEDALMDFMMGHGLWSSEKDKKLESLPEKIIEIKETMYQNYDTGQPYEFLTKPLERLIQEERKLMMSKYEYHYLTADGYADGLKNEYLLKHSLQCDETITSSDIQSVSMQMRKSDISTNDYRAIVRSDEWLSYWSLGKMGVFTRHISELSQEQRVIASLSRMYDNAYEDPDCPPDKVLDNPYLFDGWLSLKNKKNKADKLRQEIDANIPVSDNQVFVIANQDRSVKDIQRLNSPQALRKMKEMMKPRNNNER